MKKQILLMATLLVSAIANAQTDVNIEKLWGITGDPVEINEPMTVKEGVAFIGDTRTPEKIAEDGKYKGMKVQKQKRFFKQGVMNIQFGNALSFRGAASGISKDKVVDVNAVPRSRMIQVKPLSGGKLFIFAAGQKEEVKHLYVGIRNEATFKNLATLEYVKDADITGKKDAPYAVQFVDYTFTEGDELWIYSEGGINLYGLTFDGKLDNAFAGSDPVAVSKAVKKARK